MQFLGIITIQIVQLQFTINGYTQKHLVESIIEKFNYNATLTLLLW